ncbi:Stomatin family [Phytophthora cactorum]|nr:Stomatin family [Phytophthora cactorum]
MAATRYSYRVNHLVQKDIGKPIDAMKQFNAKVTDGRIPIVLTPSYPTLITLFMKVPSGLWVLKQKWNAHADVLASLEPRLAHVTKQAVTYSNPVRGCPTSDNVMVDIDISISFQIGPTEDDAYTFVYTLGAHRFDELLYSLTEEAIRGLVHSVRHDQVHDLREEFAQGMKTDLNAKLKSFGVFIHNVKVTNVDLPQALSRTLEETTAFKTRMEEQEKNHENQMRILLNQETQKLTALEKNNERAIQDLQAESVRAAIIRDERRTIAEAKAQVRVAEHVSRNENKIKAAEGYKADAVATATAKTVKDKAVPLVELNNLKTDFEQFVNVAKVKGDARIQAAEKEAKKIQANAEAEGNSAAFLKAKREFDYKQKKIRMEAALLESVPLVISGKNGDQLIQGTLLQTIPPAK